MHGGDVLEASKLEPEQWRALTDGYSRLGRVMQEKFGLQLGFYSHADSHVSTQEQIERFLDDTDPQWVSLCLETGHVAYYGGDNEAIVRNFECERRSPLGAGAGGRPAPLRPLEGQPGPICRRS
jgi:inosose dehydratase